MAINEILKDGFAKNYAAEGLLPYLSIKSDNQKKRMLIVGAELGDDAYSSNAILKFAGSLREKPMQATTVDLVPVLDTAGYPDKRTAVSYEGMGKPVYLNSAYLLENKPAQLSSLEELMGKNNYDIAIVLRTINKEDYPAVSGFFGFTQVQQNDDDKKVYFDVGAREVILAIANRFRREGLPVQMPKEGYLGDGHVVTAPGFVMQGYEIKEGENNAIKFATRDGFLKIAAGPAAALHILSSRLKPEAYQPEKAYKVALDTIRETYR